MDLCSSATVFKTVGFENPTAVSLIVAGTNFVMTVHSHLLNHTSISTVLRGSPTNKCDNESA